MVSLSGCAHAGQKTVKPPPRGAALTTVFVYPFGFRWNEPAYRSFELSQRLIDSAITAGGNRLAFYGPNEFTVMRANDDGAWVATTALGVLMEASQRPEQGVILRPWAEKRTNTSSNQAFDAKGKAKGTAATEETTYIGHVEIVHPSTKELLVEIVGEQRVDPFAAPTPEDDFDSARTLTVLMARLTQEAIIALKDFAPERPASGDYGLTLAVTPKVSLAWFDERPSGELEAAKLNAVDRELFTQTRAKFIAPWLTDAEVDKMIAAPAGTWVGACAKPGSLGPGDLILTIDGELALPQKIARHRFKQVPAQLRVRKSSGVETDVLLQ